MKASASPISVRRTQGDSVPARARRTGVELMLRPALRPWVFAAPERCQACSALMTSSSANENSSITTATAVAPA